MSNRIVFSGLAKWVGLQYAIMALVCFDCPVEAFVYRFSQECSNEPTVEFPATFGSEFEVPFRVTNAATGARISFWTFTESPLSLSFQSFENDDFIYSVTSDNPYTHLHTLQAKDMTLGNDLIEILFSGSSPHCVGNGRMQVQAIGMETSEGAPINLRTVNGGTHCAFSDYDVSFAFVDVFHSDAVTRASGAVVEVVSLNGIPIRERRLYDASYPRDAIGLLSDLLGPAAVFEVRACWPLGDCEVCTDPVTLDYENPGWPSELQAEPVRHDFILPIPPPIQNPRSDINQDNKIDAEDLLILLEDWGKVSGG